MECAAPYLPVEKPLGKWLGQVYVVTVAGWEEDIQEIGVDWVVELDH